MPDSDPQAGLPDMRISDADRQEMADILGRHFADGRLDEAEFHERLNRAMAARTQSQLGGLLDDLPRLGGDPEPVPAPVPARPRRRRARGLVLLAALLAVLVVSTLNAVLWPTHVPWLLLLIGAYMVLRSRRWHHGCRYRA